MDIGQNIQYLIFVCISRISRQADSIVWSGAYLPKRAYECNEALVIKARQFFITLNSFRQNYRCFASLKKFMEMLLLCRIHEVYSTSFSNCAV